MFFKEPAKLRKIREWYFHITLFENYAVVIRINGPDRNRYSAHNSYQQQKMTEPALIMGAGSDLFRKGLFKDHFKKIIKNGKTHDGE